MLRNASESLNIEQLTVSIIECRTPKHTVLGNLKECLKHCCTVVAEKSHLLQYGDAKCYCAH